MGDWGLGIRIVDLDWEWILGIRFKDCGLEIRIEDRRLGLGIGVGD